MSSRKHFPPHGKLASWLFVSVRLVISSVTNVGNADEYVTQNDEISFPKERRGVLGSDESERPITTNEQEAREEKTKL